MAGCGCSSAPCSCGTASAPCSTAPRGTCTFDVPHDCAGADCTVAVDPITGEIIAAPGVCAPGPANVPNTDPELNGSIGVCLQPAVDEARALVHDLGLRGYRVWLVWQRRNSQQRFEELRRVELYPVLVSSTAAIDYVSTVSGMTDDGEVTLSEISPAQTNGSELFGEIPEFDYHLDPDVEFFYEIARRARCAGDAASIPPGRYTPSSLPYYDAENFQWTLTVTDQEGRRTPPPPIGVDDLDGSYQTERDTLQRRRGRLKSSLRT